MVILWGAFVRASYSGDGCGNHWPFCDGKVIPALASTKQIVEFSHRVSSGLLLPIIILAVIWSFKVFPKGHLGRRSAFFTLLFTLTEALLGAGLVKFEWVARDASVARTFAMGFHLMNTFLLLASMAFSVWYAAGGKEKIPSKDPSRLALGLATAGMLVMGISGAVSALGHTIFESATLADRIKPTAHFLLRLSVAHPLIATSVGVLLLFMISVVQRMRPDRQVKQFGSWCIGLFLVEYALGLVNIWLEAPIAMQIVHLFMADVVWIALMFTTAAALAVPKISEAAAEIPEKSNSDVKAAPAGFKAYIALTKPRVISLLLFTTMTAMFIAKGDWPGWQLFWAVLIGGYAMAGAANAINMIIDRDIDGLMKRTATRPTVTEAIPAHHAGIFACCLGVGSFALLWGAANLLTAIMAASGLLFYVVIYTLVLKRRTWQNIVIGGAAGCFPVLVGYASIDGTLSPLAWILFGIVFLWTPVHFWALALMIKDDYAEAGIPMLPVVRGERATVIQIAGYAVLTALISVLPTVLPGFGIGYLIAAIVLNAILIVLSFALMHKPSRPKAFALFKYSMVYLALLFLVMAVDRSWQL